MIEGRTPEWLLEQHDKFLAKLDKRTMELLDMGATLEKRVIALEKMLTPPIASGVPFDGRKS